MCNNNNNNNRLIISFAGKTFEPGSTTIAKTRAVGKLLLTFYSRTVPKIRLVSRPQIRLYPTTL